MNHAFTVWLTGLPCSGKTSIGKELLHHIDAFHLDGDIIRNSLSADLGFSREDRTENLRRVSVLAQTMNDAGLNVIASFVSPYHTVRQAIQTRIHNCILVHVHCSLNTCIQRDTKGMYQHAMTGKIQQFTGISDPYEEPKNADVTVNTDQQSVAECANTILQYLYAHRWLVKKASLFIGRFSPFHNGHKYMFDSVLNNGGHIVVAIRDSPDQYTADQRKQMIETVYQGNPNVTVIIIPDIDKVCVGRGVGYQILAVPPNIHTISATAIRQAHRYDHLPPEIVDLVQAFDQAAAP